MKLNCLLKRFFYLILITNYNLSLDASNLLPSIEDLESSRQPSSQRLEIKVYPNSFYSIDDNTTLLDSVYISGIFGQVRPKHVRLVANANLEEIDEQSLKEQSLIISVNVILHSLQNTNLTDLTLYGLFDENSVALIGRLTSLKELSFEEGSYINCNNYTSWSQLENLTSLNLENSHFAQRCEAFEPADIPFKSLVNILRNLKMLNYLNLSKNEIFPSVREKKYYTRKGLRGKKIDPLLENYNNWRYAQIANCAQGLASDFCGQTLLMRETHLGDLFIDAYSDQLKENNYLNVPKEMDFSENYIKIEAAAHFAYDIRDETVSINFSRNHDKDNFVSNLRNYILDEYVLTGLNLEE